MPIINLSITAKPDPEQSRRLATEISELTRVHLKKDPTITAVTIHHIDPVHWFAGGRSLAEQGLATFWLDIKVVNGTNTKTEIAAYLEAVYATLTDMLGDTHSESYILVHEVPAAAYGFTGKTQEFRFISGRMQASQDAAQ
jgi:4-oxalocrotonate tautomerase